LRAADKNLQMIRLVAKRLGPLLNKVAFLGGAATALLITDRAMPSIRPTLDVDVIVKVVRRSEYYKLEESLRSLGFVQLVGENDPVCRWSIEGIIVDVMPTIQEILGFSNRWYSPALENAQTVLLDDEVKILLVTAPYFLATKIEAFYGRGRNDYLFSHDIEDIVTLIDGDPEILGQIKNSPPDLKRFLSKAVREFLKTEGFLESLPGHLLPDSASQARITIIIERLQQVASVNG
jgi:predicted nucleotidyltransferase